MRGLMSKPSGEIMETPVKNNFKDGLNVFEYFISTHGARKGQADTALKTAQSGYLTRKLVDVAQDVVISMLDCNTLGYIELEELQDSGEVVCPLQNRVFGRIIASDVKDPVTAEPMFVQGHVVNREDMSKIASSSITRIPVRSVLTCQSRRGVCSKCYGIDLSKGEIVDIGATVGIIAAQSVGEPGTQLTMRTFHVGGTATLSEQSYYFSKVQGVVQLRGIKTIKNKEGQNIVMSRKGKLFIVAPDGRDLQKHDIEYGSVLLVEDAQEIRPGIKLVEWDPSNKVIMTEFTGYVRYADLIDNVTIQSTFDSSTNRSAKLVLENRSDKYQPAISIVNEHDDELAIYYLPSGAYISVENNQKVNVGDILLKTPRETSKTKDITGGLPRISELFEARIPKDAAVIADANGEIVLGGFHRGLRKVTVVSEQESFDYFIPRGKQLNVMNGDRVSAGDKLTSGSPVLADLLRILGPDALQRYLVNQIQHIYRSQGVDINDRHIELIVRQMLRKVRIADPGDTEFLVGDRVDKIHLKNVNSALQLEGKRPAVGKPIVMGITLASLGTESFISAASFQETTRILAEAAISGTVDYLYGLKENVVIGKLIPAGTGVKAFRKKYFV